MRGLFFYVFAIVLLFGGRQPAYAESDTLVVGIYHNPPFVIKTDDNNYEGLSIELWENISANSNGCE